ncbi:uncharacterized protein LOC120349899 [Nilaparvata lugens]|uniref:uncharacterized protein LOC120349899 n=1 Tax=Nilaparvata lugens TaxID=108931 RepID=UPI00193DDE8B|nr:uncharacterized protein LOC120349899 [Nilaparvata lugens]
MITQSLAVMLFGWKQWTFASRVAAMENLTYSFGFFSISTDLFLMANRTSDLITMIRSNYYVFDIEHYKGYSVRERKMELIKTTDTATVKGVVMIEKILRCLFVGYMTLPAVSIVFYYFQLSKIEDLRLPFIIFVPKLYPITLTFSTIHQYLFATGLNIVYLFYSAIITITVFKIMLLSVNNVLTEMKLFHLNFEEIDMLLEAKRERGFQEMETGERIDGGLKRIMRHVVEHHKVIFRKVGILNSGLKFRLFYFNTFSCLQICLSIFSFMKGELTFKIKHGIVIFGVVMNCFFICDLGQKLQDEGEQIRNNLIYGCNWLNKPNWMNKVLLFMMIQNNKLPKLGLFNVFTLNRNNLRVIVQGAYSYFNLLKNISN